MNQDISIDYTQVLDQVREAGLFSSVCAIHSVVQTQGNFGSPTRATGAAVDGLDEIPCMVATDIRRSRITQSIELKLADRTGDKDTLHCLLDGHYPQITKEQRAVITGSNAGTYDIRAVESDSQGVMTRLGLQRYGL